MASPRSGSTAEDPAFEALFHEAVAAYQTETKRDLQLERLEKTLKTPEDLLTYIEAQGELFRNFRNRHGKLWTRMRAVLQPITTIGTLTQTAINPVTPFGPAASAVLGAVLHLVTAAKGVTEAYDYIYTLFNEFETFAVRLRAYTSGSHDLDPALQDQLGAILRCMLRLCGRAEAVVKAGRFREYLRHFVGRDDKTKDLLDELDAQLKNEGSLVTALNFGAAKSAEVYSKSAASSGNRIEQQLRDLDLKADERMKQNVSGHRMRKMKQMLENPAVDRVARLLSAQKRDLVNDTGTWLEKEAHFVDWRSGRIPILWVLGGPGSGKSYLATRATLRLQEHFNQQSGSSSLTVVAYFFIKDYDACLVDANNILKTLALQIAEVDSAFGRYVASYCMDRIATITEDDTWESLFAGFYSSVEATNHHAILILDGLDEAPAPVRKRLLAIVKSTTATEEDNRLGDHIQFGIFGRTDLRGDFEFGRQDKIIEVSLKNQDDIKTFILSKLPEIKLLRFEESKGSVRQKQARKLRNTITKKVLHNADGIFLSAKLHMEELEELNAAQMGRALENPPKSLDETISQLFRRILQGRNVDITQVNKMMFFICFARHPLSFGELDLFLRLSDRQPDVLLWYKISGRFASLFETKYPNWYLLDSLRDNDEDDEAKGDLITDEPKALAKTLSDSETAHRDNNMTRGANAARNHDDGDDDDDDIDAPQDSDGDQGDDDDYDFDDNNNVDASKCSAESARTGDDDNRERASTIHDKGQLMTSIQFTHQRIKDFLIGDSSEPDKPLLPDGIHVDAQRAEVEMAISCLQALLLCDKKKEHRKYSADYAAKHFVVHLANIQENCLTPEGTKEIIVGLVNLFQSDQTSQVILIAANTIRKDDTGPDEFWKMWINCQTHRETVQRWLRRPEVEMVVTDREVLRWVHQAKSSPVALLEPMMRGASRLWLTKTGHDDENYRENMFWLVDILRAYVSMDKSGVVTDDDYRSWCWIQDRWFLPVSFDQLSKVAEWAGLEKTSHWYTGLGWMLMLLDMYDEAIAQFDKASELDLKAWMAMEGKARSFSHQKRTEEAIVIITKAIANVPPSLKDVCSYLYRLIAEWRTKLGDKKGAREAAAQAFDISSGSVTAHFAHIAALCNLEHNFQVVVDALAQLHKVRTESGCSKLVLFLSSYSDLYDKIGLACRESGTPSFVLEAIDQALEWSRDKASKQQRVRMMTRAARIRHHYYSQGNEAIQYHEKALRLTSEVPSDGDKEEDHVDRRLVRNELSLALFDMAVAAKKANQDYSRLTTRLRELSVASDSSLPDRASDSWLDHSASYLHDSDYTSLLWGRWLREYEESEKAVWCQPFRARLLDEINMLDDDIPENDSKALLAVAKGHFHAGDRETAGAVLAVIFKLLEDHVKDHLAQSTKSRVANEDNHENDATEVQKKAKSGSAEVEETNDRENHVGGEVEPAQQSQEAAVPKPGTFKELGQTTHAASTAAEDHTTLKAEETQPKLAIENHDWMYFCEHCERDAAEVTEMYFCEVCNDVNWCDECLPLFKQGEIARYGCNPEHSLYRAWPVPEKARHNAVVWLEGEPRVRRE